MEDAYIFLLRFGAPTLNCIKYNVINFTAVLLYLFLVN